MIPFLIITFSEFKKIFLCKLHPLIYIKAMLWYILLTIIGYGIYRLYYTELYIYMRDMIKESDAYDYINWIRFGALISIYLFVSILTVIFIKFPKKSDIIDLENLNKTAILITCHNSEDVIKYTIEQALYTFLPEQIYIADNNNTEEPVSTDMKDICNQYKVNYLYFPVGCKGNAIKGSLNIIDNKYQYILTLDDDTLLPTNFNPDFKYFDDEKVSSIGFGIKMKCKDTLSERFGDFEYKLNSLRFYTQNYITNKFIIGIAGIWKRDILHYISHHNPTSIKSKFCGKELNIYESPYAEDSFNGLINRLLGYKQKMDINNFVESYAPPKFYFNINDLICKSSNISGYNSLNHYAQRALRWYRSVNVRMPVEIYLLFTYNASNKSDSCLKKVWRNTVYRLTTLWNYALVYFAIFLIYNIVFLIIYKNYFLWGMLYTSLYLIGIINNIIINYYTLKNNPELQIGWDVIILYPLFTKFILICRCFGFLGAFIFHIPFNIPFLCIFSFCKKEIMCNCLFKKKGIPDTNTDEDINDTTNESYHII